MAKRYESELEDALEVNMRNAWSARLSKHVVSIMYDALR